MPAPSPLHRQLGRFEGVWTGSGIVFPNPWGPSGATTGSWNFRLDPGGFNLLHDYVEQRSDGYRFDAHGVLTVDPAADEYVWFWFDSYGFPPLSPARGRWDGARLVLEKTTPRGVGRSIFTVHGDELDYAAASRLGTEPAFTPVVEGTYRRDGHRSADGIGGAE
ncbi:MAG TPA: DUF1579 family protein [Aliidongia sp.]|uniref:DUF1579 family protein n=1 Tax=Aliidongia sp. TaxID=1914230 RepID=UPI002DDD8DD9|nr:DUF1579 family protein [Aliidongia sp.]HEV2676006.1 DUF1579 family protein [Aliidongia sp.]